MDMKQFATDRDAETEGVWHDLGDGARIRVARAGNDRWKQAFRRVMGPYRQQIKRDALSEDRLRELSVEVEATTILVDWEGLEEGGEELDYSAESAARLLTEYPEFRSTVNELADDMRHYRMNGIKEDADDLGNG